MNNSEKENGNVSVSHVSRRTIVGIFAVSLLLIGVMTVLSTQIGQDLKAKTEDTQSVKRPKVAKSKFSNYVTANPAGRIVALDRKTGLERDLTKDETRRFAEGLKQLINQSTDGLVEVKHEDGSISMDLQGRFQDVMLAKTDADGNVSMSCADNLQTAADFFEIDPKLLGVTAAKGRPLSTDNNDN